MANCDEAITNSNAAFENDIVREHEVACKNNAACEREGHRQSESNPLFPYTTDLSTTLAVLRACETAIFPTDTVYGIGVAVDYAPDPAVLYDIKERDRGKPVAWLVGSSASLERYGRNVPPFALELARRFWPGALTLVVQASAAVSPAYCSPEGTVALRMPDNATALALMQQLGCPLATTSANISGKPAVSSSNELDPQLCARVAAVLAAEASDAPRGAGLASAVVDCTGSAPRILREGAIPSSELVSLE